MSPPRFHWLVPLLITSMATAGCGQTGTSRPPEHDAGAPPDVAATVPLDELWSINPAERPPPGVRRLTQVEVDRALELLVGEASQPASLFLPQDSQDPYDNNADLQISSSAFVSGAESLAREVVGRLALDDARLDAVVACPDTIYSDPACLEELSRRIGRRALRRPLSEDEVTELVDLGMSALRETRGADVRVGVTTILEALLQHIEFYFRKEIGVPTEAAPEVYRLEPFEVAEKLAFFLTGEPPSDALLDRAALGALETPDDRRAAAHELLDAQNALAHWDRFHAQWLGWVSLASRGNAESELLGAMRRETRALLERTIFDERRPWTDLFKAEDSWLTQTLSELYGLPEPEDEEGGWVSYGDSGRRGLLSHGTFLSLGTKFDLVSVTRRGFFVRTRFMCQAFGPPPPNVNADQPPDAEFDHAEAPCRTELYAEHTRNPTCKTCHDLLDPIGWGLENYGRRGQWIDHEPERPHCPISGDGEIKGLGTFRGPAELGDLLVDNELIQPCLVEQLYRYAVGRTLRPEDRAEVNRLVDVFRDLDERFDDLVVEIAASEHFVTRRSQ